MYGTLGKTRHVHLIGIGGAGMSAIAEVLLDKGFYVSGSDLAESDVTRRLERRGAKVFVGHNRTNIQGADVIVHSSAVRPDKNEEVSEACAKQIPVIKRDEMVGELMRYKAGICVAGTHGKTTTTTMIGMMLEECGARPTVMIGGVSDYFKGSAVVGKGDYMVIEADEYDRAFLKLTPTIAVITTLEAEHLDTYKDLDDIKQCFVQFANAVPFYGAVVCCIDEPEIAAIQERLNRRVITYGTSPDASVRGIDIVFGGNGSTCKVVQFGETIGELKLNVPGLHNIKNALAAVTVGLELGLKFSQIQKALEGFGNVRRRFQVKYQEDGKNGPMVIDDYAHHPTEVRATLDAARTGWPERRLVAVFQPHLYSRTKSFHHEFGSALAIADEVFVTDVYPAREDKNNFPGVTGMLVAEAVVKAGQEKIAYIPDREALIERLVREAMQGKMIVMMGAGDITNAANEVVSKLKMERGQ
ncbi:MAG: UDP-N-acetylmuramate--L-alanine ligase [Chlorobiales bacterium]|nr:UDP-N-acetylmuramate--L-alanine ligase [Chlorobiales bacterium]